MAKNDLASGIVQGLQHYHRAGFAEGSSGDARGEQ
jgi:hypothetical protein